jgi:hypothetical protein
VVELKTHPLFTTGYAIAKAAVTIFYKTETPGLGPAFLFYVF